MNSNEMTVALRFARLLNQARIYLTEDVSSCSECENGILQFDDVPEGLKKGDTCPFCMAERAFLALCNREVGPIIRTPPAAVGWHTKVRAALRGVGPGERE